MKTLALESTYVMGGFLAVNNRDTAQIRRIGNIFVHENFVPNLYEQDIAMLWVNEPFTYSSLVLPVCLPPPSTLADLVEYKNSSATLTGWGRKWDNGPLSDQLLKVDLPVISNDECMRWYDNSGSKQLIPESTFLCAGYENGTMDACSGDSGGPLVQFREDQRAEVIGVVSWGIGCGVKGRPGVYTRVSKFVKWIHQTIEENKDDYPRRK
ncbi:serine proteinase stubble [Eurytemora carolleeae]|uniref:serine proteinase stubble n=1 Tax=Eurytemora carolleeae TaxID=1294199 RepID=UPI000C77F842|nr:serine proteinase stubble [Eurytemora carolleeae]|eukprot:XP_023335057.1 serine proteinase stubble-like [Eurytemora affinis]